MFCCSNINPKRDIESKTPTWKILLHKYILLIIHSKLSKIYVFSQCDTFNQVASLYIPYHCSVCFSFCGSHCGGGGLLLFAFSICLLLKKQRSCWRMETGRQWVSSFCVPSTLLRLLLHPSSPRVNSVVPFQTPLLQGGPIPSNLKVHVG